MKIINRIMSNGSIVGYLVSDDDKFTLPMVSRALYTEMYIVPLVQAGYKYYSYNADAITDPDGNSISELPPVELSTLDEIEWNASLDFASTSAMSDSEASRYYSYKEEQAVNFRAEASYEINTREELLQYLDSLEAAFYSVSYSVDNRPLNAIVNPDALFTIEELIEHPEYKRYFRVIIKRHHFRNYSAYRYLLSWLREKGALNVDNPTMGEFLAAYYSWGPEGIKDKCTQVEVKLGVDGIFSYPRDILGVEDSSAYIHNNREIKTGIVGADEKLHFLRYHEDLRAISDVKDFGRDRVILGSNDAILRVRRSEFNGRKYVPVNQVFVSDVSDRIYMTLVADNGYTYLYKASHNRMKIGLAYSQNTSEVIGFHDNFAVSSVVPNTLIELADLQNENDYGIWNMAIIRAAQIIKSKTVTTPVSSTADFLIKDGVNPVAAIDYMAHAVDNNKEARVNKRYALSNKDDSLMDAFQLYLQPLPEYLLNAFMISEEDLEDGVNTFLELADVDDLLDRRQQMMENTLLPGQIGYDTTFRDKTTKFGRQAAMMDQIAASIGRQSEEIDAVDYYTKLKFVSDCIQGNLAVDNFGEGQLLDIGASYSTAAECLLTLLYAEYGDTVDLQTAMMALSDIEGSSLVNTDLIFRDRDNAMKGYMVDFATFRKTRACTNTWVWAYCTKVFRELSNAPVEKQRPYLMELVVLENQKPDSVIRELMTECVKQAVERANLRDIRYGDSDEIMGNWSDRKCIEESTEYIAATLFFYVYAGGVKTAPVDGNYYVTLNVYPGCDLEIRVPENVYNFIRKFNKETHLRYMTVYDYCKYEYNPNTSAGTFAICLVNANVDPWHVKPKKGYKISTYSLMPNYYAPEDLDKANGEGFYELALKEGAVGGEPLKGKYKNLFLPTCDPIEIMNDEDACRKAAGVEDLDYFMDWWQTEHIFAYIRRWTLERKAAKEQGKKLVSIPLKQDIIFGAMASLYCDEIPEQIPVYTADPNFNERQAQTVTTKGSVSWRDFYTVDTSGNLIELNSTVSKRYIREFSVQDIDISYTDALELVVSGQVTSDAPISVSGNYIHVAGDARSKVLVSRMSDAEVQSFIDAGIFIPISQDKLFLRAMNGDYTITK